MRVIQLLLFCLAFALQVRSDDDRQEFVKRNRAGGSTNGPTSPTNPLTPMFEDDILPILAEACLDCHGSEIQEAQLDLRTATSILQGGENGHGVIPGDPARSLVLDMIVRKQMPPDETDLLTEDQISTIRRWIRAGIPAKETVVRLPPRTMIRESDRQFWAFQTPVKTAPPAVQLKNRVRTPIDRFLLKQLEENRTSFAPDADKATLLRRAHLALTGIPPSPKQLEEFLADQRPNAWNLLIDRLLQSPQYGERWGRHWLDAVGYVDNRLFDGDLGTIYPNEGIWRYRDYVVDSLNADKPYDQFLTEQLAGDQLIDWKNTDELTPEMTEKLIATGFFRSIEDATSEAQYGLAKRYEVVFDTMTMLTSAIMGLTIECCRCHNHKFDPLPQRDYYRLMAFLEPALNPHDWLTPQERWLPTVSVKRRKQIDSHNAAVQKQIDEFTEKRDNAEPNDRITVSKFTEQIQQLEQTKQSYGKIQALWDTETTPQSRILRRGQVEAAGVVVQPGFPEVLSQGNESVQRPDETANDSTGLRLALARWLTNPKHPLTARVIVNRVWHHHFGTGIVATPGNFGRTGSPPAHPRLLDWLSVDFIEHGWSLKRLHKQIMTSTTYRQSSLPAANAKLTNTPGESLLATMPLRRLESEIIRDCILAVSGRLDSTPGGPSVMVTTPVDGLSRTEQNPTPTSHLRRSLYIFARRVYPLKFMEVFDSPIMPVNCTKRMTSTTVLQSFTQLNDSFMLENAVAAARRVRSRAEDDIPRQVDAAFRLILSRPPDTEELQRCTDYLKSRRTPDSNEALDGLCHMLLCTNEFLYIH
ncbi:MAG: PSD1 and planctomycete cytochrome C domain-containing protein [Fuerstiella sp.]|nr:PSD1 and planctomycete cytochrome C domain-containing protein [Fuerstiella sp.]